MDGESCEEEDDRLPCMEWAERGGTWFSRVCGETNQEVDFMDRVMHKEMNDFDFQIEAGWWPSTHDNTGGVKIARKFKEDQVTQASEVYVREEPYIQCVY